jgi:predicted nucleotidyltransferase
VVNLQPLFLSLKQALLQQDLSIDVYIFGSVLHNNFPSDIDILIIYNTVGELSAIKNQLFQISLEYPLDIYYMTPKEACDLDFINVAKAVTLESLTQSK